jgi:SanA protein
MRLILYVGLRVVAVVLMAGLLAWYAERRLDRAAEAKSFSDVGKVPAVDVALVLGTAPIGPEGGPNRYFVYRLDAAAALYKAGKVKYFIVSGHRDGRYDEPSAMRAGLVERGVPEETIFRDFDGDRTLDSVVRARQIYGQTRLVIVSQRFHLSRALFLAAHEGIEAWGFEASDVDAPYSIFTELRRYPSAVRGYWDVWTGMSRQETGKPVTIGVDPPD